MRDDLALVLDCWLAVVTMELATQERLKAPPPVTSLDMQRKLSNVRQTLRKAS